MNEAAETLPRLLIADDSRMVRASIIKQIRDRFDCREEIDGETAWEALVVDSSVRILITDIGMPRLDGYSLIKRVRSSSLPRLRELPIIVISGEEDGAARDKARELGANDFITKGIGSAELVARLDTLSSHAEASGQPGEGRAVQVGQELAPTPDSGCASVLAVGIDDFDRLVVNHGRYVAERIAKKLNGILSQKVRGEDAVMELGAARFAVVSPLADMQVASAFARGLQGAVGKLVLTWRGERIRIGISAGIASAACDGVEPVAWLTERARERLDKAQAEGGNRIVVESGEALREAAERSDRVVSVDQALTRLRLGGSGEVERALPVLLATLRPLLALAEEKFALGLPMGRIEAFLEGQEEEEAAVQPE